MADFERPTIHYTELGDMRPDSPIYQEWNTYRREVPRLLAEGHEGRWVLIKEEAIIGIYDSNDEAMTVGRERYLLQPFLVHHILSREPVYRIPLLYGSSCRT